jgi:signal transduction histidine kinase
VDDAAPAPGELEELVREHAALRRVATVVAQQPSTDEVFAVVTREAGLVLGAWMTGLLRVEDPQTGIMIAGWSRDDAALPLGSRAPLDGRGLLGRVVATGEPTRLEDYDEVGETVAAQMRRIGVRSAVAGPIRVGGRIWGALSAAWPARTPMPAHAEDRVAAFAELVAYAIENTETRDELAASRARLVHAADEQRRSVVRDLHDGAQQRLIHAVMTLQLAQGRRSDASPELAALIDDALADARAAIDELRELARGIHPAILSHRGLAAAVEALADRAPVPVDVEIAEERYPASVESAAYFVVAEALTNVAKYARATTAHVTASATAERLVLTVEDDGVGGAVVAADGGLSGLRDRLAALGGTLAVDGRRGGGTRVRAEFPLGTSPQPL